MSIELLSLVHTLDEAVGAESSSKHQAIFLHANIPLLAARTLQAGVTPLLQVAELAKQPLEMPAPQGLVRSRNC